LRGALAAPVVKHFAAMTDPAPLGEILRAIDGYSGQPHEAAARGSCGAVIKTIRRIVAFDGRTFKPLWICLAICSRQASTHVRKFVTSSG